MCFICGGWGNNKTIVLPTRVRGKKTTMCMVGGNNVCVYLYIGVYMYSRSQWLPNRCFLFFLSDFHHLPLMRCTWWLLRASLWSTMVRIYVWLCMCTVIWFFFKPFRIRCRRVIKLHGEQPSFSVVARRGGHIKESQFFPPTFPLFSTLLLLLLLLLPY